MKHECVYGVTSNNEEVNETLMMGNISDPIYYVEGVRTIGVVSDYLDQRRNLMSFYKHCPYCGEKLEHKKFKELVKSIDYQC